MDAKTIVDFWMQHHAPVEIAGLMARMRGAGGGGKHIAHHMAIMADGSVSKEWEGTVEVVRTALTHGSVALVGLHGTGKTQLAHVFLAEYCLPGEWCTNVHDHKYNEPKYVLLSTLLKKLRSTFSNDSDTTEYDEVAKLTRSPLLIIDELQDGSGTGFQEQTLTDLMAERYRQDRPTIFCANVSAEHLSQALGPSIVDRFQEGTSGLVECTWGSLRGEVPLYPSFDEIRDEAKSRITEPDYNAMRQPSRASLQRAGVQVRGPLVPPPPAPPSLSTAPEPDELSPESNDLAPMDDTSDSATSF